MTDTDWRPRKPAKQKRRRKYYWISDGLAVMHMTDDPSIYDTQPTAVEYDPTDPDPDAVRVLLASHAKLILAMREYELTVDDPPTDRHAEMMMQAKEIQSLLTGEQGE